MATAVDASDPAALIGALTRLSAGVQRVLDRCASEHRTTAPQARLLRVLSSTVPTINELALQLGLDKSSTSGLVDRAQRRGLVRRVPSQLDRRSVRVRLTAEGRELLAAISAQEQERIRVLLEPLTAAERAALAAAAGRLLHD